MTLLEWLKHIAEYFAANGFTDELEKEIQSNVNSFDYKICGWLYDKQNIDLAIHFITKKGKRFIWLDRNGTPDLEEQVKKLVEE